MKRMLAFIAFAAGTMFAGSAAGAAPPDAAQRYASCLVQMHPQQVQALLNAAAGDVAQRAYGTLAADDRCLTKAVGDQQFTPDQLGLSIDMLRGRLAEQALLGDARADALPALPLQQKRYIRAWFAATGRHPAVDEMATCMADTDPGQIMGLVRTPAGSAEEIDAIGAMGPALTRCLSAGTRLDASRQALRAALADALYQRLNNPALSAAKGTERGR